MNNENTPSHNISVDASQDDATLQENASFSATRRALIRHGWMAPVVLGLAGWTGNASRGGHKHHGQCGHSQSGRGGNGGGGRGGNGGGGRGGNGGGGRGGNGGGGRGGRGGD